ncbi:DNA cytosine methyltransferase [Enterococcus hermanniensis]|nr:DNA cytosine methyltransferase [Enterococcus hermanniensis]
MSEIKYLDLFAGAGGLTEGFMQAENYKEVAAVEWLKPQVDTLRHRMKTRWGYEEADESILHFDIQREDELFNGWSDAKFGDSRGLDYFVNKSNGIDMVIGGPPCQAYSVAGRVRDENGMQDDYRNYLFEHYLSVVSRYQPKLFVFENVPGMLSAQPGGRKVTDLVKSGFKSIGYEILDDLKRAVINAKDYGVPQSRKRVVLVGVHVDSVDNPENIQNYLEDFYSTILPSLRCKKETTVQEAIGDLQKFVPIRDEESHKNRIAYEPVVDSGASLSGQKPRYQNLRDIGIFHMLAKDLEEGTGIYSDSKALSKVYEEKVGSSSPIHRYHVLKPDKPSTTIIAHLYKDGNRFIHYDSAQSRTITPREAARLQSFPDDFEFVGSQGATYQMIGNAVPPKLAEALAQAVRIFYKKYF